MYTVNLETSFAVLHANMADEEELTVSVLHRNARHRKQGLSTASSLESKGYATASRMSDMDN